MTETAREWGIPKSTVSRWKAVAWEEAGRSDDVGDLLLEYLSENLHTLRAQAEQFRDRDWLERQDAADVALLHGVLTDKVIRLLEALSGSGIKPGTNGNGRMGRHG